MRGWLLLAVAVGVNYAEHRAHRSTICAVTRRVLHTNTPAGRVALLGSWGVFSGWLLTHLLRGNEGRS